MRILLITSREEDYLQDSIIHGFKQLLGKDAVEYPLKPILYNDYDDVENIHGKGFTLYGLLNSDLKPNSQVDFTADFLLKNFDLIIFTSIQRQYNFFYKHFKTLKKTNIKIAVLDGEDTPDIFPFLPRHFKRILFYPKPHRRFLYFKRELFSEKLMPFHKRVFQYLSNMALATNQVKTISFSIPEEKIISYLPKKTKLFTEHIVDPEVALKVNKPVSRYVFSSEKDYYSDIQESKFGITTKRAGWDCLRHYEIAANGSVICFKHLNQKPLTCAPHGLQPGYNCISYNDYNDLISQTTSLTDEKYEFMQTKSLNWVKQNTTILRVQNLLSLFFNNN